MISEKRLAANRENAARSTGPRTDEGKARSRRNSLKHGLTGAGVVLTENDTAEVEVQRAAFAKTIEPANEVEAVLVERMALASVRMNRCVRVDNTRRKLRMERVRHDGEVLRQRALNLALERLAQDAAEGRRMLGELALGCAWVIEQWKALDVALGTQGFWSEDELAQALRMIGKELGEPNIDDPLDFSLRLQALALVPELDLNRADDLLDLDTTRFDPEARRQEYREIMPEPAEALAGLRKLVAEQVGALQARVVNVLSPREQLELAASETLAEVDSSTDAMRLARYESMNELAFHRNWNAITRLRKAGAEKLGVQPWEENLVEAQNEPSVEHSSLEVEETCNSLKEAVEIVSEAAGEAAEASRHAIEAPPAYAEPIAGACEVPAMAAVVA